MSARKPKYRMRPKSEHIIDNLPGEIWKEIPGYENSYAISNMGRVLCFKRRNGKVALAKQTLTRVGYFRVQLSKHSEEKRYSVHRLVAVSFVPNPLNLETVNHINLDKTDNRATNLEWLSVADNIRHARNHGLNNRKPVVQMDLSGNEIKVWESAWKAQQDDFFCCSSISACCRGKLKTHRGYKWKFYET